MLSTLNLDLRERGALVVSTLQKMIESIYDNNKFNETFYPITADGAKSQLSFWMIIGRSSMPRFLRHCETESNVMKQGVGCTRVDVSAVTANHVAPFSRGPSSIWTPLEDWKAIKNKREPTIDICETKWNFCILLLFQLEIIRTPRVKWSNRLKSPRETTSSVGFLSSFIWFRKKMQRVAKVGMPSTVFLIQIMRADICPSQKEETLTEINKKMLRRGGFILLKHDTHNSNRKQNEKLHKRDSWPLCFCLVCPLYLSRPAAAKFRVWQRQ